MRLILSFLAIGMIAMMAVAGFQVALEDAGEDITVANETFTPDAGNVTTLEYSNQTGAYYSENATVYDENGTEMAYGDDYLWYSSNGTVETVSGGGLDGDADATISYSLQQTTAEQRRMAGLVGHIPRVAGLMLPMFALVTLVILARGG